MTKLHLSVNDKKIAGVCGGLSESTGIDSDLVRAAFLLSIFVGGMGLLLYIILWIVLPEMVFEGAKEKTGIFAGLKRSRDDKMLAGVCGGIAEYVGWDVSLIRLILIVIVLAGGVGIPLYVILWILMPKAEERI